MQKKVACSEFVKRQTEHSGFSHFDGTWEQLEDVAISRLSDGWSTRPGYKDGVVLVDMPAQWFRSAIVELQPGAKMRAAYEPRREGEAPYIRVSAKAKKQVATHASVVLYSHAVLAENNEADTDAEWEIVAIKARTSEEEEPMHYYTMARNFLHLPGGTQGDFSADDFAKSIIYWHQHSMMTGKTSFKQRLSNIWSAIFD